MTDQNIGTQDNATDAATSQTENQAVATKTYSQDEVDNMMARMRGSLEKKLLKPYQDLGDPEELRALREEAAKRQTEQQIKRGEFEKKQREAAQHRADVEQKLRERTKEPGAPLPVPNK